MSGRKPWRSRGGTGLPRPPADPDLAAQLATAQIQLKGSRERSAYLGTELARATRAYTESARRVEELELVRDSLAGKLAAYESEHNVACGHAKEAAGLRGQLDAQQTRLDEYQAREEARDRAHDHTRSFIPDQRRMGRL